jgi:hypothetical protein
MICPPFPRQKMKPQVTFTIGLTGHRKLPAEQLAAISHSVTNFFAATKQKYSQITVFSSLAAGADILCAKLALDMGFRLVAPLPLPASEYRQDFTAGAAGEFDRLVALADECFAAPPQETVPARPPPGFYYRQAAIYVVKHCDVLLAVWDGIEHDTPDGAGTWETVKLARQFGKAIHRVEVGAGE